MPQKTNKIEAINIRYTDDNFKDIKDLISSYSDLYKRFEEIQIKCDKKKGREIQKTANRLLPGGDQKTGVIGEYYAAKYVQSKISPESIYYACPSAPHDIEYSIDNKCIKIQVKAVSAHSETRRISPIKKYSKNKNRIIKKPAEWDYLYLISLNKKFIPDGLWIIPKDKLNFVDGKITYATMPETYNKYNKVSKSKKITKTNINDYFVKDFCEYY